MDDHQQLTNEKVKSGEYYKDALEWYNSRFVRPKTELVHSLIIAATCLFLFFVTLLTFLSIFPLETKEKLILSAELQGNEIVTTKSLDFDKKNPTIGIIHYTLREYVKSREEYIEERINRNFRYVTEVSDENVFDEYIQQTDLSNPNNPILLYGKQAKIEVEVARVQLPKLPPLEKQVDPNKEYKAKIRYILNLLFLDNDGESRKMQADITFKYKELKIDQETHEIKQLPEIIITGYKTRQL